MAFDPSYIALIVYLLVVTVTTWYINRRTGHQFMISIIGGLILGQIALVIVFPLSRRVFKYSYKSIASSPEMIFWMINLLTPFIVYIGVMYFIYFGKICI